MAIGRTFGAAVPGLPLCAEPLTLLYHELSPGASHAVLHHFWSTGPALAADRLWVEYYLDDERSPSISFQPSQMCGLAAAFLPSFMEHNRTDLYNAGALCGRNSAVGGFFNTFPIPFGKNARITVRADPIDCRSGCCGIGFVNVRGTENLPVVLPSSGIPLPPTTRLHLQRNDWSIRQPAEFVPIVSVKGADGLIFMTTLSVEAHPVGGDRAGGGYIEGCWQFYSSSEEPYPGIVVGTGVEDYFDSSYYFGADAGYFGRTHQISSLTFRNELAGLTFFQRENGVERLSAYRFHSNDPLVFNSGGKLIWWVGQCRPFGFNGADGTSHLRNSEISKCGNTVPTPPRGIGEAMEQGATSNGSRRRLTPINVSTYGWYYTF